MSPTLLDELLEQTKEDPNFFRLLQTDTDTALTNLKSDLDGAVSALSPDRVVTGVLAPGIQVCKCSTSCAPSCDHTCSGGSCKKTCTKKSCAHTASKPGK